MELFTALQETVSSAQWDSPVAKTLTLEITIGEPSPVLPKLSDAFRNESSYSAADELTSGVADIARAFSLFALVINGYDSWLEQAQTYELNALEQDDTKYQIMMRDIEEQRASVPVVLYAMVDQVGNRASLFVQEVKSMSQSTSCKI